MQGAFNKSAKQLIIELIPTLDEHHLLVEVEDAKKVSLKKTPKKKMPKKASEEVGVGEKTDSSSEFMMYLMWTSLPCRLRTIYQL